MGARGHGRAARVSAWHAGAWVRSSRWRSSRCVVGVLRAVSARPADTGTDAAPLYAGSAASGSVDQGDNTGQTQNMWLGYTPSISLPRLGLTQVRHLNKKVVLVF